MKLTREELENMTSAEIANHLTDITQTDICKDEVYCKMVVNIFMNKQYGHVKIIDNYRK